MVVTFPRWKSSVGLALIIVLIFAKVSRKVKALSKTIFPAQVNRSRPAAILRISASSFMRLPYPSLKTQKHLFGISPMKSGGFAPPERKKEYIRDFCGGEERRGAKATA